MGAVERRKRTEEVIDHITAALGDEEAWHAQREQEVELTRKSPKREASGSS